MTSLPPIVIQLDRPREVAWTHRADMRFDSLPRARRAGSMYQLCALIWAALVDRAHPFEEPEDLGEFLVTSDQVKAAGQAIVKARERATDKEKNAGGSTPKPSPSSSSGSAQSNSGDSPPPSSMPMSAPGEAR